MQTVHDLEEIIKSLSSMQIKELFNFIVEIMSRNITASNLSNEFKENRFSNGEACMHCGSTHVNKHGKLKDKQRYKCMDCGKTFNDLTMSSLSCTKLPLEKWVHYAHCMLSGNSIRKSAQTVGVCVKTSFYMRHKLLDCIRAYIGIGNVEGIVELDETFQLLSYKGNHKKSGFVLPRPSRHRGGSASKRGISSEQVCIATAIDRSGNIILEPICTGRISHTDLERLFKGHISDEAIICTDSHRSYEQFAKELALEHKRIMRGRHKNGIYHINHVNSLHSLFKNWIRQFKGVSTKYFINYLYFFKALQYIKEEKETAKHKNWLIYGTSSFVDTRIEQYKQRKPIFV